MLRIPTNFRRLLAEFHTVSVLGLPILGGQLAQQAMTFVDTTMAGSVSPSDLAAVSIGSSLFAPVFITIIGILMALPPAVSRLDGAGDHTAIPQVTHQALYLALIMGPLGWLVLWSSPILLQYMDITPVVREISTDYIRNLSWGVPALALYQVFRFYTEGLNHTRPVMIVSFLGLAVNIPTNYIFIYGGYGISPMGGAGCGAATSVVIWVMLIALMLHVRFAERYRHVALFPDFSRANPLEMMRLFRVGGPIGFSLFLEIGMFALMSLIIALLGPIMAASHQVALNFVSLLFMVPLSVSMAATIRVGNALGKQDGAAARFSGRAAMLLNGIIALFFTTMVLSFREQIPTIYTENAKVIQTASGLLLFAALFQFADSIQIAAAGALRGYDDTRFFMAVIITAYWIIALPAGIYLSLYGPHSDAMGARGFWIAAGFGLGIAAVLLVYRFEKVARRYI